MSIVSRVASLIVLFVIVSCVKGQGPPQCHPTDTEFHPDFIECASYWTCFRGQPFQQWCPGVLLFDRVNNLCDFPEKVDCTLCPPIGILTVKIDCNNYRFCVHGQAFHKTCPTGTWFDPEKSECNAIINGENPCPFEACRGVEGGVQFQRNRDDCAVYHICVDGREVANRTCPANTAFVNGTCSNQIPTECTNNQAPNPPPAGTRPRVAGRMKASLNMGCPRAGTTFIMAAGDCSKYVVCSEGQILEEKSCPDGLFFHEDLEVCSLPSMAYCPYE